MRRFVRATVFFVACFVMLDVAPGQEFWHRAHLDAMRMNCWPEPFSHTDRDLVRRPLFAMTSRGWQLQNTLSDHFFRAEDQSLTQAGQFKLRWMLTQVPSHRRSVFVLRTTDSQTTADRLEAVRYFVDSMTSEGARPEVLVSDIAPAGGSGDYFDQVDRQMKASVPAPRLPPRGGISSAGS